MSDKQTPEEKQQAREKVRRITQRSTIVSIIGGLLFGLFGYILYKITPAPNVEQKQSVILQTEPKVAMEVLQKMPDGSWGDLDHTPDAGDKVAFKVSTTHPIHIALFAEANHKDKHLIIDYLRVPPGEKKILKVIDKPYTYEVKPGEEHVVFCMVVVREEGDMKNALATVYMQEHLDNMPKDHCASW